MSTAAYISEILAAIFASYYFYKYKNKPIRLILVILWLTVVAETAARIPGWLDLDDKNNHGIYNCYSLLFYGLFFKMVYNHILDPLRKKITAVLSVAMLGVIIYYAFTTSFFSLYMSSIYSIATMVTVLLLLYYAIDLLKSNKHFSLKEHRLELSVFSGYLLFMVSFIPLSPFVFGIWFKDLSESAQNIFYAIQLTSVILMNLLIIFGFIWTTEEH